MLYIIELLLLLVILYAGYLFVVLPIIEKQKNEEAHRDALTVIQFDEARTLINQHVDVLVQQGMAPDIALRVVMSQDYIPGVGYVGEQEMSQGNNKTFAQKEKLTQ